ncbi:MAG TPA: 16S rRNA (uracil(1498)-N(3))-methyltransferase [Acidobacteriota bacterium]|nr:16S rRNA (uracil(1498)-N(3))-methyltransferase [Acidobacteriota bacterium]HNH83994.1 16S rRNA (uracil(1498)-N(3))-methyltransferase [Acidobacteriota bacterium]
MPVKHRFFASPEHVLGSTVALSEEESHHAIHVIRLRTGDEVSVFDGCGQEWTATVVMIGRKQVTLELIEKLDDNRESPLELTLAAAQIKADRFEWLLQKAVELGVSRVIPLITTHTEHGVIKQDSPNRRARWARIVLEATKQCGRRQLMELTEPQSFQQVLENFPLDGTGVMFVERATDPWFETISQVQAPPQHCLALVGPEGGWSQAELENALQKKFLTVTLGPRILRAETAGIVAATLLQNLWGDLG